MLEFISAGGWVMYPLQLCALLAVGIIAERYWTLTRKRVMPPGLVAQVWEWLKQNQIDKARLDGLRKGSPLGRILAAGLVNRQYPREQIKESIEEVGGQVAHEMGRFLTMLGTIAAIAPLLGLLGTVFGMIEVFSTITSEGVGNASALAGGISKALITTATGLCIAIPSLIFYRALRAHVDNLVVAMEQESLKLLDVLHHWRNSEGSEQ